MPSFSVASAFTIASAAAWVILVVVARLARNRMYATFVGVLLGIHTLTSVALFPHFGVLRPLAVWLQVAVFVHFLSLARARLRPLWYRALVSIPASYFTAGTLLSLPWAVAVGLGLPPYGLFVPFAFALLGLLESVFVREETREISLDGPPTGGVQRVASGGARRERPLRIVQLTDPHLGPFMSERRLTRIVERAVKRAPDLVLLTGDFITMESQREPEALARALAPLSAMPGRVFACLGNHDHEALDTVRGALQSAGVELLVDDARRVETGAGAVQIVGANFVWRERSRHLAALCAAHPREPGVLRIVLLHDPGAFKHLPEGEGDLVLSGHTHGGQVGLVAFGLAHTFLSLVSSIPDHGLWGRGTDRLYVHRGTGHYGFPLRVGVPAEQSLLEVHWG